MNFSLITSSPRPYFLVVFKGKIVQNGTKLGKGLFGGPPLVVSCEVPQSQQFWKRRVSEQGGRECNKSSLPPSLSLRKRWMNIMRPTVWLDWPVFESKVKKNLNFKKSFQKCILRGGAIITTTERVQAVSKYVYFRWGVWPFPLCTSVSFCLLYGPFYLAPSTKSWAYHMGKVAQKPFRDTENLGIAICWFRRQMSPPLFPFLPLSLLSLASITGYYCLFHSRLATIIIHSYMCVCVYLAHMQPFYRLLRATTPQWSGRFLGITGWDPSVCKFNRYMSTSSGFPLLNGVYSIDSIRTVGNYPAVLNFNRLFLKLNRFNCN